MVGATGFEPAAPWSRTKCATRLRYAPTEGIIHDLRFFVEPIQNIDPDYLSGLSGEQDEAFVEPFEV